ncbi:Tex family protein, partial [Oleiphilus sp. HI0123]
MNTLSTQASSASTTTKKIAAQIASELSVRPQQVDATIELIDEGSTIPFIARYRKEVTGALDDSQLRKLEERLRYLRELDDRRKTILSSIDEQGKLTDALASQIANVASKNELEDLYLPYKPKRRTKGQIAIEAGLEPLADSLFKDPTLDPESEASKFISTDKGIDDSQAALDGAKYILMERLSEEAKLLGILKTYLWDQGEIFSAVVESEKAKGDKFQDYFDFSEAIAKIPSHRALALFRGRNEGVLNISLQPQGYDASDRLTIHPCEAKVAAYYNIEDQGRAADKWLKEVVRWTWRVKLNNHIETELLGKLREQAEKVAIDVFAENLKDLLLAAPAGAKATLGLDPGLRTGVKVAVIDQTGKLLDHATIYPHAPRNQWDESIEIIAALCKKHHVELLSIGNGTASRETDKLAADVMKRYPALALTRIMVSEAGASVYSASELAANEFPDLDVTIRGAVSIARRLQDPLAELVKIEPKAIGVGQYQHDVSQVQLNRSLGATIEDCVNAVGVDVNTASAPLLAKVSGLNASIASNIVAFRDSNGRFNSRKILKEVPRLGPKAFEQCAGFLRILDGENPLDASAVHPESYPTVKDIAQKSQQDIGQLIGNAGTLKKLSANDFVSESCGLITVQDIFSELAKPGRDPRPEFKFAEYKEGVETISDLKPNMVLEGAVTNVTHFGAFVDIGVHQDGLVHISALADKFVKDPRDVVKTGDIVKVKVMEADPRRKRISLSMRMGDEAQMNDKAQSSPEHQNKHSNAKQNRKPKQTEA